MRAGAAQQARGGHADRRSQGLAADSQQIQQVTRDGVAGAGLEGEGPAVLRPGAVEQGEEPVVQHVEEEADRVVLLGAGRVLADGRPGDVLTPATIEAAFGARVRVLPHPDRPGIPVVVPTEGAP